MRESENALLGKTAADCRYAACRQCGVCDTAATASGLERGPDMPEKAVYGNILNKPQRDQEAHSISLDQYGRVIVRHRSGEDSPAANPGAKSKPPALAPHLIKKAAQWRIRYARTGAAAYLSQLELQHIFDRALRRAGIPLSFSQGFHPLPLVSFGRALPVGVASECEWFSVFLREERFPEASLENLNKALPKGVRVTGIEPLSLQEKTSDSTREVYRMELLGSGDAGEFSAAWRRVAEAPALIWRREGKKGVRELDARTFFADIVSHDTGACFLTMDWSAGYVSPLALCLHALGSVGYALELQRMRLTRIQSFQEP